MRTVVSDPVASRRAELAGFLRAHRADLHPEDLGLFCVPGRRNTPGLRREEVAQLSGVSVTWYTWLEQARQAEPSSQVIDALARAFRLDAESHRHLRRLAGLAVPEPDQMPDDVGPELHRLLATIEPSPACVLGPRFDFLDWNCPFDRIWQPASLPPDRQNLMWLYFAQGTTAHMIVRRQERARHLLGQFRATAAQHAGDERFAELIAALHGESALFREWWPHYSVEQALTGTITVRHPKVGTIRIEVIELRIPARPSLTVSVHIPARLSDSDRLARI
ncbi:MAG: helix-turn-helix transcriptional regulator [Acidimicrobiales bacterium]